MSRKMKEAAFKYYRGPYNCSQCILKAAEEVYNLDIHEQCFDMCQCYSNGLGVGSTCVAIEVGLFIFGLMFDHDTCIRLRVKLMTLIHNKYHSIYCHKLRNQMKNTERDCSRIIGGVAEIIGQIIDDELNKKKHL
ncbi:C-GCAxxG-C-C family (seleno)protein [Vallitalea okinawensis]|uniref:C-GCAxxG-C-C family (seleno)protein n=1 Tax=Vallitalea okinawensis TaxID=2078660 RepID=UPI000CFAA0D7|nr:C-GCAxxG-C-C family (seleno)protein [Vallitalea okinawensis]